MGRTYVSFGVLYSMPNKWPNKLVVLSGLNGGHRRAWDMTAAPDWMVGSLPERCKVYRVSEDKESALLAPALGAETIMRDEGSEFSASNWTLEGASDTAYVSMLKGGQMYVDNGAGEHDGGVGRRQGVTFESVSECTPIKTLDEATIESPNCGYDTTVSEMIQSALLSA